MGNGYSLAVSLGQSQIVDPKAQNGIGGVGNIKSAKLMSICRLGCSDSGNPTESPLVLGFADSTQPTEWHYLSIAINQT